MNRASPLTVGVLDWGVGGFGAVQALQRQTAHLGIVYVSDSGTTPYGLQSGVRLRQRLDTWHRWFERQGCDVVLVACNAASTVCESHSSTFIERSGTGRIPVYGLIEPTVTEIARCGSTHVGVIGGERTIKSGAYPEAARRLGLRMQWTCEIAQPLSSFVERGQLDGTDVEREVSRVAEALQDVRVLVNGCTHYQALRPVLERCLPHVERWLEPADIAVQWMSTNVLSRSAHCRSSSRLDVWTTGDADNLVATVRRAFGLELREQPNALDPTSLQVRTATRLGIQS